MVRKATENDIEKILDLLEPHVKSGIILKRTYNDIFDNLHLFYVCDENGAINGVASYYRYSNSLMEIRSLAIRDNFYEQGTGSMLVKKIVEDLKGENENAKIFALTTTPKFFIKCGFFITKKETLPEKIWKDCIKCIKKDLCDEIPLVYEGKK